MFDEAFILTLDRKADQVTIHKETHWACTTFLVGDGQLKDKKYDYIDEQVAGRKQAWNYTKSIHAIVNTAIKKNLKTFLLFEDDATIAPRYHDLLDIVVGEFEYGLKYNWDLFYLGSNHVNGINTRVTEHIIKSNYVLDWHAVIINHTAYDIILSVNPSTEHTFDGMVGERMRKGFINAYCASPSLVTQKPGWSHNEGKFIDRSVNHNI